MNFKEILQSKGAREFHIAALSGDETRALAAIETAEQKGVEHVLGYALTLYENPSWAPTGAKSRQITNTFADVNCPVCHKDRFVWVTDDPEPYGETVKPCPRCNAGVDAGFWKANGERFVVAS